MRDCGKYEDLLARHLHGNGLLQDRELLEEHLSVCPDCERLYRDVSDLDRMLRDLPGKQVDPPPYLHSRILANLPERGEDPWRPLRLRWPVAAATAVAGIVALAIALEWGGAPRSDRVASAPPAVEANRPPVLQAAPGTGREREPRPVPTPEAQVVKEVKIFFYYPPARTVAVTGDFNEWDPQGVPLTAAGKPGLWETQLRVPPGVYSYNFIVDGELLVPDPNAPTQMPDGYGGTNSVLLVKAGGAI